MLKTVRAAIAASVLLGTMVPGPAAAAPRKFNVHNTNPKASVQRVWYARTGEAGDPWREVVLDYAIKPGDTSPFTMADGDVCLYDVKIQFSDNYIQQHANVNVCRGDTVTAT